MKRQGNWWNVLIVVAALTLALAGCAALQKNDVADVEGLLAKAGFSKKVADTAQKLAHLKTLPQHKLFRHNLHGNPYVMYADATYCTCPYVGNETNLRHYRDLEKQQNVNPAELMNRASIGTGETWSTVWGPLN